MPIRILFVAGSLRFGGSEQVLLQILQRLDRSAFEPHLALLHCEGQFLDRVPGDVRIHAIGAPRARLATLPFVRLCWAIRPQVAVSFAAHLNSAVLLAKTLLPPGMKLLIREGANITLPDVTTAPRRAVYRFLYRHADAIISQSDDMTARLTTCFGLSQSRLFRIHNSVDAPAVLRAAEGSSPYHGEGPHLAFVGRFVWIKGTDFLISSMPEVLKLFSGAMLTLVGEGPLRPELAALAKRLGVQDAVRFAGFQKNPLPFLRYADVVVIPSRSEAFSNVALEALSLGTPVVATDCPGGMREIARCTDRLRLSASTPAALARTINAALSDFRSCERISHPEFLSEFSPVRMIRAYEELIKEAVHGRRSAQDIRQLEMTVR